MKIAHVLSEPAAATPVTDGENVYVFFRDFGVVSYDAAGAVRWKKAMGPFANRMGAVASPIIAGVGAGPGARPVRRVRDRRAVAGDRARCSGRWRRRRLDAWTTPALYAPPGQPAQIVTAGGGLFGGHSVESGARLWTHKGMAPAMVASPVVTGDTVVGFGYGYDGTPPFAEALTKSDKDGDGRLSVAECGTSAWWIGIARYFGNRDGFIVESEWLAAHAAVEAPSSLVAVSLVKDADGVVSARELWRYEKSFVAVVPSPLVLDGLVYTIKNGGILTVLRADTGEVVKTGRVGLGAGVVQRVAGRDGRPHLLRQRGRHPRRRPRRQGVGTHGVERPRRAALRDTRPVGRADLRPRPEVAVQFRRALSIAPDPGVCCPAPCC